MASDLELSSATEGALQDLEPVCHDVDRVERYNMLHGYKDCGMAELERLLIELRLNHTLPSVSIAGGDPQMEVLFQRAHNASLVLKWQEKYRFPLLFKYDLESVREVMFTYQAAQ
jgi:hypothetical protein